VVHKTVRFDGQTLTVRIEPFDAEGLISVLWHAETTGAVEENKTVPLCCDRDKQGDAIVTKRKVEKFRIFRPKDRFFKRRFVTQCIKVVDFFQKYAPIKPHFSKKNCEFSV
jgi:hypothetical protein